MDIRLSEATVDLSVMEHKIHRKKVGAGKNPSEFKGQGASAKVKAFAERGAAANRLLSSTARLQHCLGEVKSSILPRIYLNICSLQRWKNPPQASPNRDRQLL